jgi:hypothetical protein
MKNLQVRVDIETGRLFFVKRAQRKKICPGALERDVRADHIDDVAGGADLIESCLREEAGHSSQISSLGSQESFKRSRWTNLKKAIEPSKNAKNAERGVEDHSHLLTDKAIHWILCDLRDQCSIFRRTAAFRIAFS